MTVTRGSRGARSISALYLFCGQKRRADLGQWLRRLSRQFHTTVHLREVDILLDPQLDLSTEALWASLETEVQAGRWDVIIVSPPCNTFSRARFRHKISPGPRPLRTKQFIQGFPWASEADLQLLRLHNYFADKSIHICHLAARAGKIFLFEHPEDLATTHGERPGTVWDFPAMRSLSETPDFRTVAIFQCWFQAPSPKPTRLATNCDSPADYVFSGWPQLHPTTGLCQRLVDIRSIGCVWWAAGLMEVGPRRRVLLILPSCVNFWPRLSFAMFLTARGDLEGEASPLEKQSF